jgi:hypothetical protein
MGDGTLLWLIAGRVKKVGRPTTTKPNRMSVTEKVKNWMLMWGMHRRTAKVGPSTISAQASPALGSLPTAFGANRRFLMVVEMPKQTLEVDLFWVPIPYTFPYSENPTPFVAVRMFETD